MCWRSKQLSKLFPAIVLNLLVSQADLTDADLEGADLRKSNLINCNLERCLMDSCDLREAVYDVEGHAKRGTTHTVSSS